jgi:2-oxoacid:acceptor oxidoreductase, gamma subunit, pyruvate/2-ketoisovalerate family
VSGINRLYEIRWHGRGGQGVVTAAQIITSAAILKGYFAMTFPEFGPERRGAPVKAYTRISFRWVYHREPILNPDYLIILDPALLDDPSTYVGIKSDSTVIVNSPKPPKSILDKGLIKNTNRIVYVDAVGIALKTLGKPIVNTAIIGALLKVFDILSLDDVKKSLGDFFRGELFKLNWNAILKAYNEANIMG